jgi:hypothetical protein
MTLTEYMVRKDNRRGGAKKTRWEQSKRYFISGERKSILLEGSQAMPARHFL